jgi:hypothetical protein
MPLLLLSIFSFLPIIIHQAIVLFVAEINVLYKKIDAAALNNISNTCNHPCRHDCRELNQLSSSSSLMR